MESKLRCLNDDYLSIRNISMNFYELIKLLCSLLNHYAVFNLTVNYYYKYDGIFNKKFDEKKVLNKKKSVLLSSIQKKRLYSKTKFLKNI